MSSDQNRLLKTPMDLVAEVVLRHIKEVFKWNYSKGNFYFDPEKEMYIRADYPQVDQDHGFKPGFVLKSLGGVTEDLVSIGDQSFLPQDPRRLSDLQAFDTLHSGSITLRAISEADAEASRLAYYGMISINQFRNYMIGKEGIVDIHCYGFGEPYPYEAGSYTDAFACDLQVRYAKREAFVKVRHGQTLEGIDTTIDITLGRKQE